MSQPIQIAISGAGGNIGYALAFRIAAGGLFGTEQPVALHLLESAGGMRHAEAMRLELKDCAFPLLHEVRVEDDPLRAFAGADWIILLGGTSPRGDEVTRIDLLHANGPIFAAHGQAINQVARSARILVVATPSNTNCLIARSHAPYVPDHHWFTLMQLDRLRATAMIAEEAGVPVSEVTHVAAWGNHSESVYIDVRNSRIGGRPALEVLPDESWPRTVLEPAIAGRTAEIIDLRGGSPAASAAQAILTAIWGASKPTLPGRIFNAGVVSDGSYGVPRGLIFGFPVRSEDGEAWSIIPGLYHDDHALGRLALSVAELEHEAALVTDLLDRVL